MKLQPVLNGNIIICPTMNKIVFLFEFGLEWKSGLTFIINVLHAVTHNFNQSTAHCLAGSMHTYAVCLHDHRFTITIYNQSGQSVAFAMYQSICIVVVIICNADALPHFQSTFQTTTPKRMIDFLF